MIRSFSAPTWWEGPLPFEVTTLLSVNVTWFCPVKCSYCHVTKKASLNDRTVISEKRLAEECERARGLGVADLRFSGGDPAALGEHLFELARVASSAFGKRPVVLTSGIGVDETWVKNASDVFSAIQVSVENPLAPMQTVTNANSLLGFIKSHRAPNFPIGLGLTLVGADDFERLPQIFDLLFEESGRHELPQIGYPCHLNFEPPNRRQLDALRDSTTTIFSKYGYVPFYFTDFVGSLDYKNGIVRRIVVNLNPDGTYGQYDNLVDGLRQKVKMELAVDRTRSASSTCKPCAWKERCTYHLAELGQVRYDWCKMRVAIWDGLVAGMEAYATREETMVPA